MDRKLIQNLSVSFRRLRVFKSEKEWSAALLDACAPFCTRCALLVVNGGKLEWKASRGFEIPAGRTPVFAVSDAAAFAAAIESREIAIALCLPSEVSSAITHLLGADANRRVTLVPVSTTERVAAVVYAEDADAAGLELISITAGLALDSHAARSKAVNTGILQIAPAVSPAMSPEEEEVHLRAQRFARKHAAEIRLHEPDAVEAGRAAANLYTGAIRERVDTARDAYAAQFGITITDYLHLELVRTLAGGDEELLGADYPGPLR